MAPFELVTMKLTDQAYNNDYVMHMEKRTPEQNLCAAMLNRALLDATGLPTIRHPGRPCQIARIDRLTALHWIYDDNEYSQALSFKFVCDALSVDGTKLRRVLNNIT